MNPLLQILIVEDDEALRETLADLLMPEYCVHTAANGIEAFEMVKSIHIDVVLTDVCMANGSGIELLDWIRARHPTTPTVILITGHSQTATAEAIEKGAYCVLTKPFTRKSLIDILQSLYESKITIQKANC